MAKKEKSFTKINNWLATQDNEPKTPSQINSKEYLNKIEEPEGEEPSPKASKTKLTKNKESKGEEPSPKASKLKVTKSKESEGKKPSPKASKLKVTKSKESEAKTPSPKASKTKVTKNKETEGGEPSPKASKLKVTKSKESEAKTPSPKKSKTKLTKSTSKTSPDPKASSMADLDPTSTSMPGLTSMSPSNVTEITISILGRSPDQAFFLEKRYWDMPIKYLREIFVAEGISMPMQYKFLTNSKSVISLPGEEKITLKNLLQSQMGRERSLSMIEKASEISQLPERSKSHLSVNSVEKIESMPSVYNTPGAPPKIFIYPVRPKRTSKDEGAGAGVTKGEETGGGGTPREEFLDAKEPSNTLFTIFRSALEITKPSAIETNKPSAIEANKLSAEDNRADRVPARPPRAGESQNTLLTVDSRHRAVPSRQVQYNVDSQPSGIVNTESRDNCPFWNSSIRCLIRGSFAMIMTIMLILMVILGLFYSISLFIEPKDLLLPLGGSDSCGDDEVVAPVSKDYYDTELPEPSREPRIPSKPDFSRERSVYREGYFPEKKYSQKGDDIAEEKNQAVTVREFDIMKHKMKVLHDRVEDISRGKDQVVTVKEFGVMKNKMEVLHDRVDGISRDIDQVVTVKEFAVMKNKMEVLHDRVDEISRDKDKAPSMAEFNEMKKQLWELQGVKKQLEAVTEMKRQLDEVTERVEHLQNQEKNVVLSVEEFNVMRLQMQRITQRIEEIHIHSHATNSPDRICDDKESEEKNEKGEKDEKEGSEEKEGWQKGKSHRSCRKCRKRDETTKAKKDKP